MTNCIDSPSRIVFGEFACDDAVGVMLAHTLIAGQQKLKKGRVLDAEDIAALKLAGIKTVSGARLQDDDMPEDHAAAAVASLLAGNNTEARKPYTGRCNLHAGVHGVVVIDEESIIKANGIDEAITVGTLPPWSVVRKGQVIATVKIIPFGVNRHVMDACRKMLNTPPLRVAELQPHRTALIMTEPTGRPGMKDSALAATALATRNRLATLGSRLALELRCPHEPAAIADRLRQAHAAGCKLILICGATSTKDRNDIAPSGIVAAGGKIRRFGMPVEPGNMLLLAELASVPVLVLPGCARSRRLNGLDWILHRLLAKLPLDDHEFAAMGIGGLIRSVPEESEEEERPTTVQPPQTDGTPHHPRIAALVLAAGRSSRMGNTHKLLASLDGIPIGLRAVNAALASLAASVTVVTGHEAESIEALVAGPRVATVHNPDYAEGMSTSLRCGIAALPPESEGVLVMLGDMPHIDASHLDRLIEAFAATPSKIIAPMQGGKRGNPVLWPRHYFTELQSISGDQGAREMLMRHAELITEVEMTDEAIFFDVDEPQDLARNLPNSDAR